jgi:hypothetical protein
MSFSLGYAVLLLSLLTPELLDARGVRKFGRT